MNIELKVGTVFRWNNFPDHRYGEGDKARWFVCVGSTGVLSQVACIYSHTTTTQLQHFDPGGIRHLHPHLVFDCSQYPCFEKDCAIDFEESPYSIRKSKLETLVIDVEIKGQLDEQTMRNVYDKTIKSSKISRMMKMDIHRSFNHAGITGLQRPR